MRITALPVNFSKPSSRASWHINGNAPYSLCDKSFLDDSSVTTSVSCGAAYFEFTTSSVGARCSLMHCVVPLLLHLPPPLHHCDTSRHSLPSSVSPRCGQTHPIDSSLPARRLVRCRVRKSSHIPAGALNSYYTSIKKDGLHTATSITVYIMHEVSL